MGIYSKTYHFLHVIHIYYMEDITIRVKEMKREGIASSIKDMGMIHSCMYMSTRYCVGTYYMENQI